MYSIQIIIYYGGVEIDDDAFISYIIENSEMQTFHPEYAQLSVDGPLRVMDLTKDSIRHSKTC